MPAPATVAPIRTALCGKLIAVQMRRPCPALTGTATDLYIINKVRSLSHLLAIKAVYHLFDFLKNGIDIADTVDLR